MRAEEHLPDLVGQRIYFSLALRPGEAIPIRSMVISALGVLTPLPENPPAVSFDSYLADAGMNFRLARGRLLAVEQPPTRYRMFCDHLARRLNAILSAGVAPKRPELAAVYRAMMLGQKHELSAAQGQLFMHSGTMHLFAINGLHIGVVALAVHALLLLARCPRPLVAVLTLLVLWLDVDTTGASPSALRAWLLVAAYETGYALRLPANGIAAAAGAHGELRRLLHRGTARRVAGTLGRRGELRAGWRVCLGQRSHRPHLHLGAQPAGAGVRRR
jgi:competence protein ComEC